MDLVIHQFEHRLPGIWIEVWHQNGDSLTDTQADAIMQWTMENQIGVRMAFQMWKFKTEAELTAFVLKWCHGQTSKTH